MSRWVPHSPWLNTVERNRLLLDEFSISQTFVCDLLRLFLPLLLLLLLLLWCSLNPLPQSEHTCAQMTGAVWCWTRQTRPPGVSVCVRSQQQQQRRSCLLLLPGRWRHEPPAVAAAASEWKQSHVGATGGGSRARARDTKIKTHSGNVYIYTNRINEKCAAVWLVFFLSLSLYRIPICRVMGCNLYLHMCYA